MKINDVVKIKDIILKNRIVMPPMATAKADDKGHITNDIINYYKEKSASKLFSAIIVEHSYVDKIGKAHYGQMSISDDSDIAGLKILADTIKANGTIAIMQLAHAGSAAKKEIIGDIPIGPSAILNPAREKSCERPVELTIDEIENIKNKFVEAGIRAKNAGFDGIEIHSAHGYLLNQFLSPLSNKRKDEYGGNIYNRIRIHIDIIKGLREKLGENYPIFIRMGAGDFREGGLSIEDAVIAAKEFEKAGVDVIDISGGMCLYSIPDTRPGYFDVISKPIFDAVNLPIILTGGVKKGKDIIDILNRDVCNLVGVGRAIFNDVNSIRDEVEKIIEEIR